MPPFPFSNLDLTIKSDKSRKIYCTVTLPVTCLFFYITNLTASPITDGISYSYVVHYFVIDPLILAISPEPCKNYDENSSAGKNDLAEENTSSPKRNDREEENTFSPQENDLTGQSVLTPERYDLKGQSVLTPEGYDSWFDVLYIFF